MNVIPKLRAICGNENVLTDAEETTTHCTDWLKQKQGRALAVVLPSTTDEVAAIMRLCNDSNTPIVPQGGNTSYTTAAIPDDSGSAIVLAMAKMNRLRNLNTVSQTVTVEAGCVLEKLRAKTQQENLCFPLNLGSKGSCQIGGNLGTNAGGLNALRYGVSRNLCLGLEAITADGRIINLLSGLPKNNTGYDIKNLLIGSEGTLGVITAATLKLFALPANYVTAFLAVADVDSALTLLNLLQSASGGQVESFEIIPKTLLRLIKKNTPQASVPFTETPDYAILVEMAGNDGITDIFMNTLSEAEERGLSSQTSIATSETQRQNFWLTRELAPVATHMEGQWVKADICVPLDKLAALTDDLNLLLPTICEGLYIICFGHIGDGNLHISVQPKDYSPKNHSELSRQLHETIYDAVARVGGSFSAEHGIGQTKIGVMERYKDPTTLALMKDIKRVFDPNNIMNPGKVLYFSKNL